MKLDRLGSLVRLVSVALSPFALAAVVAPGSAQAAFSQATCSSTSWDAAVPTRIGALEFVKQSTSPAGGSGDMTRYNLNTDMGTQSVRFNSNVQFLQPYYGFFETELNYDKLIVSDGTTTSFVYMGVLNTSTTALVNSNQTWNTNAAALGVSLVTTHWISDVSVANFAPPNIAQLTPKCRTTQSTVAAPAVSTAPHFRNEGILIKTGDVLYFKVTQDAGRTLVIRLDTLITSGDFDLYVSSTTSTPDASNFQWLGGTDSASEALLIPAPAQARTLFMGVHSFSGAGHFALTIDTPAFISTRVCASDSTLTNRVTLTTTQKAQLKDFFQAGSAYLYAFSNGVLFRKDYTLNTTWSGQCTTQNGCDVCAVNDTGGVSMGGGVAGFPCGHVEMHGGNWSQGAAMGWLYAHESGHACFGLPDQYQLPPAGDASPRYCGHTTMANNSKALAFCSKAHCRDGQVSDATKCNPNGSSDWDLIISNSLATTAHYFGPPSADSTTAYPTPSWTNPNLKALVTTNF